MGTAGALTPRRRAVEEVEEVALRRARAGVGQLAPVGAGDVGLGTQRRPQSLQPARAQRLCVLADEDQRLAARVARAEVARPAVGELLRRHLADRGTAPARELDAAVFRARVDDDHLDLLVDHLGVDPVEAAREVAAAVLHRNHD